MKIQKCKKVTTPTRGTNKSAGIDFYVPEQSNEFVKDFLNKNQHSFDITTQSFTLAPNERVLIPSGIKANVPEGYALIAFNKSGVSSKYGLSTLACVVDEDYQGEIHISLVNTSNNYVCISCGQKLAQFILIPVFYDDIEVCENIFNETTQRGEGGFGSTNKSTINV